MEPLRQLSGPELYTIGWIAALAKERTAAIAMLDEEHDEPENFAQRNSDSNSYSWGRIGDHNVVIASLGGGSYGITSAATTATCMYNSFPHLRFGLLVGIGAGVPRPKDGHDIRLGDIVLSLPKDDLPGVVQYDLAKQKANSQYERVGALAPPPSLLRKGIDNLESQRQLKGCPLPKILSAVYHKHPRLTETRDGRDYAFVYQGAHNDRLFKSFSVHIAAPPDNSVAWSILLLTCRAFQSSLLWIWGVLWFLGTATWKPIDNDPIATSVTPNLHDAAGHSDVTETRSCIHCNTKDEIKRPVRRSFNPRIHFGTIASGNLVVKDGVYRDQILQRIGAKCLCFEMEAAGLMNDFPCVVIRGICDYADSHKSDRWQEYAAIVAAAYAKALLGVISVQKVEVCKEMREVIGKVSQIESTTRHMHQAVQKLDESDQFHKILSWLDPPDASDNLNTASDQRQEGTGQWFLEREEYISWKTTPFSSLWIYGHPGCGKTILSSKIVKDIQDSRGACLYFYFTFTDTRKQSLNGALRSLIAQLFYKNQAAREYLSSIFIPKVTDATQPDLAHLCSIFKTMAKKSGEFWLVLDAIDERNALHEFQSGQAPKNRELLPWIKALLESKETNFHVIVTSRREGDIHHALDRSIPKHMQIPLRNDFVNIDIRAFIQETLKTWDRLPEWQKTKANREKIEVRLMEKADGMFRWVACQIFELRNCRNDGQLQKALDSLPPTLDATYAKILKDIHRSDQPKVWTILQFLLHSEDQLYLEEVVDIVAVSPEAGQEKFEPDDRLDKDEISMYCPSLFVAVTQADQRDGRQTQVLQLAHSSVKEYLLSNRLGVDIPRIFEGHIAKASMARVCLAYLLSLDYGLSPVDFESSYSLAPYAAQYWARYASQADQKSTSQLIRRFLRHKNCYEVCYQLFDFDFIDHQQRDEYSYRRWMQKKKLERYSSLRQRHLRGRKRELFSAARRGSRLGPILGRTIFDEGWLQTPNPPHMLYFSALEGLAFAVEEALKLSPDSINAQSGRYGTALQAASLNGHLDIVKFLVERGADLDTQSGYCNTALQAASSSGHLDVVEFLVQRRANLDTQGGAYKTALQAASSHGHLNVVESLVRGGVDLKAESISRRRIGTALHAASSNGHLDVVMFLVGKGVDLDSRGGHGDTALQAASKKGHKEIVNFLIDRGADLNATGGYSWTALLAAVQGGYEDIAEILLSGGADINAQYPETGDALQCASGTNNLNMVKLLISKGADPNAEAKCLRTYPALHAASRNGFRDIAEFLVRQGADLSAQHQDDGNALQVASLHGHKDMVQLLISTRAGLKARVGEHNCPLSTAVKNGDLEAMELLFEAGAATSLSSTGDDVLALAVDADHQSTWIIQVLLSKGIPVSALALEIASRKGSSEISRMLLDNLTEANAVAHCSRALLGASEAGHFNIARALIEKGAKVDYRIQGMSGLSLAAANGHANICELLIGHGATLDGFDYKYHPLYTASRGGHVKIIHSLPLENVVIEVVNQSVSIAISFKCYDAVDALLEIFKDRVGFLAVDIRRDDLSKALIEAVHQFDRRELENCLKKGANPNTTDYDGVSLLHKTIAAPCGYLQEVGLAHRMAMADFLLQHGARGSTTESGASDEVKYKYKYMACALQSKIKHREGARSQTFIPYQVVLEKLEDGNLRLCVSREERR